MFLKRLAGFASLAAVTVALSFTAAAAEPMVLTSPAFKDGGMLSPKNIRNDASNPNCKGENMSPPLAWSNAPAVTKSFALILQDPDGGAGLGSLHLVAYGIAPTVKEFAEGELTKPSNKFVGGKEGDGVYRGPCPPPGSGTHHYIFTLIATDVEPHALPSGLTRDELFGKLKGHTKASSSIVALFGQ